MSKELVGNLVAVYGSLRQGLHNHPVLGDSEYVGTSQVQGFDMYSYGSYPYVSPSDGSDGTITVEVYRVVDEQDARSLDGLEGYPSFYDRKQVPTEFGDAWVYFIDYENNERFVQVTSGDWYEYYTNGGE